VRRTGVLADITRQKEAEELLQSHARHLELSVRERTARLQEAVSELEHFSYTLAHDLRAPLRAIRGYGELLLAQCAGLGPDHRQFLERSNLAAERMDQLIVDVLNYNKLVRQNFALAPVDCAALLQQLIESYPQFQDARASISIDGTIPRVLGNPALLTQCFSNLLNNALKFVPPGQTPAVCIFAQDQDRRVRIWFQDNGIGIAEESQGKIFQMFQQLNPDYEGTGIGLALVKKAVERMRGAVGVESQLGKGSRFWLELNKPEP
jgi:signal transduction histidine kinase